MGHTSACLCTAPSWRCLEVVWGARDQSPFSCIPPALLSLILDPVLTFFVCFWVTPYCAQGYLWALHAGSTLKGRRGLRQHSPWHTRRKRAPLFSLFTLNRCCEILRVLALDWPAFNIYCICFICIVK